MKHKLKLNLKHKLKLKLSNYLYGITMRYSDLAQDNSSVDLNMRVGIHSGRVLCGILGKKKWQFDVHSDDVKLANHTEQSGTPGRVHITEDTLRALAGKYQVEPANGNQRDTYIAQRNISTYFVIPPADRRASLAKSVGASSGELAASPDTPVTQTSGQLAVSQQLLPNKSTRQQTTNANTVQKPRFKLAAKRLINAQYFIRTIDAPFADLDQPANESIIERIMHNTIVRRCQVQDKIELVTLKFKDSRLAHLYGRPSRLKLLEWLLIALLSILCLLVLAWLTSPSPAGSACSQAPDQRTGGAYSGLSSATETNTNAADAKHDSSRNSQQDEPSHSPLPPRQSSQVAANCHLWLLLTQRSYFLMGAILLQFLITILVYLHQSEYNARSDFLLKQTAIEDQKKMSLMRDCNKSIFFNLLPVHVAKYFLEQGFRSHMVSVQVR